MKNESNCICLTCTYPSLTLKKSKRLETLVNTGFEPFLIGVNFEYFFYSLLAFIIFFI